MYYEFTALKNFISFILAVIFFIVIGFFREMPLLAGSISLIFLAMHFKDYKIAIDNEKITFYSIFKRKRCFYWTNIIKFEIEEEIKLGRLGSI